MRVSWSWLGDLVDLGAETPESVARRLTMSGLEVEGLERIGHGLDEVVLVEVRRSEQHPRAQKLTLVWVWDGAAETRVVCGAPNVPAPGHRAAWARPGTRMPDGRVLEARQIQGETSPGMLCSERELGLSDEGEGILVLPPGAGELGRPAVDALGARDVVLEVNVTPNRADCMGHVGIARELAALLDRPFRAPAPRPLEEGRAAAQRVSVTIEGSQACSRYTARVIDGVRVGPSPTWMQRRLRAVGVRPISNVVDVTNYVLFEYGQPLHAFDLEKVSEGRVVVRLARAGERFVTLDGQARTLEPDDVVIADSRAGIALGGVMGGLDSEVTATTTSILLESASFAACRIRRTSRRLGLRSEASQRFERGVDVEALADASARAAMLIAETAGGTIAPGLVDAYPGRTERAVVPLRPARVSQVLGVAVGTAETTGILERLGLEVTSGDPLVVRVPSYRGDLTREADLIEEVARVRGFDSIPARIPGGLGAVEGRGARARAPVELARDALCDAGLDEAITYGFAAPSRLAWFAPVEPDAIDGIPGAEIPGGLRFGGAERSTLANPLREDHLGLRPNLLPNLLDVVKLNLGRGSRDLGLFEVGAVFHEQVEEVDPRGRSVRKPVERVHAAGVLCGRRRTWLGPLEAMDFFDAKAAVERVAAAFGGQALYVPATRAPEWLHPGVRAWVYLAGAGGIRLLGLLGELSPRLRLRYAIDCPVFAFELDLSDVQRPAAIQMAQLPRHPAIARDVSLLVDADLPASRVEQALRAPREPLLVDAEVVEDYRDPAHVPSGKKALLWALTYRALDRTLTDAEVEVAHETLVGKACQALGAVRR